MLAVLAVVGWQDVGTYILIATAFSGILMLGTARALKGERDATRDKVARLEKQADDDRQEAEKFRVEQQKLRHDMRNELEALRKLRDPTEVLQHVLAKLDTTVGAVAELLQRSEERAAARDQAIIVTQQQIANSQQLIVDRLERLADKISGQVADKVAEVVEQLQPNKE